MARTATRLRIEGHVQGVGFRIWTEMEAARRGLRGWVRNRRDNSVEALLVGDAAAVEDMIVACHRGPPAARVTRVERQPGLDDGSVGFSSHPTV